MILGIFSTICATVFCDSLGEIYLIFHSVFHGRTPYIKAIFTMGASKKIKNENLCVLFTPSDGQIADVMTEV